MTEASGTAPRSSQTSDMLWWFWLSATLGTIVLSVICLASTAVVAVILFRRSERFHAIAGFTVSLVITVFGIWAFNTLV